MLTRFFVSLVCLAVLCGHAWASDVQPAVGDEAPELGNVNWLHNEPEISSLEELRGDVVLIERWGTNCPPCLRYLPQLQQTWEQNRDNGLHVFAFEVQNSSESDISELVNRMNLTFPIASGGASAYRARGIPAAWLIGVDGKVVFAGNPLRGLSSVLREELSKVRYPGLGLSEVEREVQGAAQQFVNGQYGRARSQAQRVLDRGERVSDAAREQAEHILGRIASIAERRFNRAEELEESRHYLDAYEIYESIAADFRREEEGDRASERMREMDRDEEIKKEMEADEQLRRIRDRLSDEPDERELMGVLPALRTFMNRYEGTRAAEDVERLIEEAR